MIACLMGCQRQEKPMIAFYYWKTTFKLSEYEKKTLALANTKRLYIRYFDVAVNPETNLPIPVGVIHFEDKTTGFKVIPVVYIKNSVMLSKTSNVPDLAKKISSLIDQINAKNNIQIQEIQIDCDWTLSSKDNYLKFINLFKKASRNKLSATIRLHQIKYFDKTKIPNVDNGVLMYYNMGQIQSDTLNSIYDKEIAARYLNSLKKYPLSLKIALPIFSNGIHIRNSHVIGLKSKLAEAELKADPNFTMIKRHNFRTKNSNYKHGVYYLKDDLIKLETVSEVNLLEMASDLNENLKTHPTEIIFYDLDELNLTRYEKDIFEKISAQF